jgi:outer membrane autotransporter protein
MSLPSTNVRCAHPMKARAPFVKRFAFLIYATTLLCCGVAASLQAQDNARTPNQAVARRALELQPNGALSNLADTGSAQNFDQTVPDALTSVNNEVVSAANGQAINLRQRLAAIRGGSAGAGSTDFSMNGGAPSFSAGLTGVTGPEGKGGPPVTPPIPENRWGVFVTGLGEFTDIGNTNNASGFYLRTGGVTLGVDYRIGSHFVIGLTAGYIHTGGDLIQNGSLDIDGGRFGIYGTAFAGGFYVDAAVTGGVSHYDSDRTAPLIVNTGNFVGSNTVHGSTDGTDLNVLLAAGYDWKMGGLSIGPTASFQYTYINVDGFSESSPSVPPSMALLALNVNDQHPKSIRTAFGMKASYDWKVGGVLIKPEVRTAWQHEYADTTYSVISSFVGNPTISLQSTSLQTATGADIGHDSLLIGAGASVLWNERISTYLFYNGEVGRANYQFNGVFGGVRVTF